MASVTGQYDAAAQDNPEQRAAALVLGRLYTHALINNVVDRAVAGKLALRLLAGAPVFQKKHGRAAVSACCGRGCALVFGV